MAERSELEALDFLLAQVCRLHHSRAHALLEEIGLYRGQPRLLDILYEQEGLTHTDLSTRLQVTPATVTKMLKRMEKAGFVQRSPDTADQRISRVYLTGAGRAIKAEMSAALRKLAAETLTNFTLEERVLLRRLLLQVRENLLQATEEAPPV